jgi:PAP2 superfamily
MRAPMPKARPIAPADRPRPRLQVSTGDAGIACWDAKFAYVSWRPVHAVQRADTDGNPATVADPTWQPLLNANHPEYTSGHACVSTAAITALQAYFDRSDLTVTVRSTTTATTRTYQSLPAVLDDVDVARIAAGLHFRYAMRDGSRLGRKVATWVLDRSFCG